MCRKHITKPFIFYCYTEDKKNINTEIKVIEYLDNGLDIIVYNKLFLFSPYISSVLNDEKRIFFDLDIVIKHNIDSLFEKKYDNLAVIKAVWKDSHYKNLGHPHYDHNINSSCMIWEKGKAEYIWEHFFKNPDYYMTKYKNGMDPYLYYEQNQRGDLPKEMFHSFRFGADLEKIQWARNKNGRIDGNLIQDFVEPIPITLFNSAHQEIVRYRKYYED
jgi:hypothetical protein